MAINAANPLEGEFGFEPSGPLTAYWLGLLRLVVGWWFFHAGITKLVEDGLAFGYAPIYLKGMEGTVLGPIAVFMGTTLGPLMQALVPLMETLIGLAVMAGVLTRLAAFGGAAFMTFFWVGNAGFAHGLVNGDLFGLLLFVTLIIVGAGRYFGLAPVIEDLKFVKQRPKLKYLLG